MTDATDLRGNNIAVDENSTAVANPLGPGGTPEVSHPISDTFGRDRGRVRCDVQSVGTMN
jgi:hypothetical protein